MGSSSRKKNKCMLSEAERHRFYKIIRDDTIREKKLGIPRKFVRNYGHHLSGRVMLKVPSGGRKWKVDIVRSDRQMLQNGWREFADYYSIVQSYFLLFEYEKNNGDFTVMIFDKTVTEIDYPFSSSEFEDINTQVKQINGNIPDKKHIDEVTSGNPFFKVKKKSVEDFTNVTGKDTKMKENQSFQKQMGASSCSESQNRTFQIKIQPALVGGRSKRPTIPASFVRKYMNKNGDALINVLDGRTWFVKYSSEIKRTNSSEIKRTRLMHLGWNKFVKDNGLRVGDVCKFELADPHKTLFQVVISRSTTGGILGSSSKQSLDKKTEAAIVEFF